MTTLSGRPKAILPGATSVVAVSGMGEPKLMRTAPRSYSLSVDLRVSNVPRQDLPISDCWALVVVAIRHADPKAAAIGTSDLRDWCTVTIAEPDPVRLPAGDDLTSRLIRLGDSRCLLQGSQDFFARHQYGRLAGLDSAASSYGQRDSRHGFVVWHISDDDEIIVTEAIPTSQQFSADGLARLPGPRRQHGSAVS